MTFSRPTARNSIRSLDSSSSGTADVTDTVGGLDPLLPQRRNRSLETRFLPAVDGDASPVTAQYPRAISSPNPVAAPVTNATFP
jgi:hypothetical protein